MVPSLFAQRGLMSFFQLVWPLWILDGGTDNGMKNEEEICDDERTSGLMDIFKECGNRILTGRRFGTRIL